MYGSMYLAVGLAGPVIMTMAWLGDSGIRPTRSHGHWAMGAALLE
jgi:hypothetical protein